MKVITHEDIARLNINPDKWFAWADDVLKNKHRYVMPPKIAIHFGDSYFNTMPSILPSLGVMGVKEVDRYLERNPSVGSRLLLLDYSNGEPLAIMDATLITAMRTGAASIHSVQTFANSDFSEVGFMGFGNIGAATLDVLAAHYKDKDITVKFLDYKDHFEKASDRYASCKNLHLMRVTSVDEVIRESDVVLSAITYTDDVFGDDSWFKAGCLVVPIHLRGFQHCDLFFDKVYGDDRGQVSGFRYFDKFRYFAETSEVLRGEKEGRVNAKERILSYNVGLSLHDVYAAAKIYEILEKTNADLIEIPSIGPNKKFWM